MTTAPAPTQRYVAACYADRLVFRNGLLMPDASTDWTAVNAEIVARWGYKGLKRVKRLAWRIAAGRLPWTP